MSKPKATLSGKPDPTSDYEIGYGRPPKHSRWAPGQSGNAKGRRKGSQNLNTIAARLARRRMTIRVNGRPRRVSRYEALLLKIWDEAHKGNPKAWAELRQSLRDAGQLRGEQPTGETPLSADDEAIVRDYMKKFAQNGDGEPQQHKNRKAGQHTKKGNQQ